MAGFILAAADFFLTGGYQMSNELITFRNAESGKLLLRVPRAEEVRIDFVIGALLSMMLTDKVDGIVVAAELDSFDDNDAEYYGAEDIGSSMDRIIKIRSSEKPRGPWND